MYQLKNKYKNRLLIYFLSQLTLNTNLCEVIVLDYDIRLQLPFRTYVIWWVCNQRAKISHKLFRVVLGV